MRSVGRFLPLLIILLAAAFLRLWRLDSVPPGLTHDEANNVHDAAAVLEGVRPFYFPVAQGKEPLYPYSVALLMGVLGRSVLVMRLTSVLWGLLMVGVTALWVRRAFGPGVALLTAAGLAVSFWPVSTARMGLRATALPGIFSLVALFLWQAGMGELGQERPRCRFVYYGLGGLALGLSFYTYLASRLMPAVPVLFGLYLILFRRQGWRKQRRGLALMLGLAVLVAAPLFIYLEGHPSAEIRIGQLDRPLRALLAGDPSLLLDRARQALLMISFRGDTFVPYNLPGKPLLDPLMSVLFYVGLGAALWRWREPACAFALLWLAVGWAPAMATGVEAANLRAMAAQPVFYLFPALGIAAVGRAPVWRGGELAGERRDWRPFLSWALPGLLFLAAGCLTYRDYFVRWAEDRDVRVHYHVDLLAMAEAAAEYPEERVAISALYPGQYHDPRVVEAVLEGEVERLRWFDGRGGLVLPAGGEGILMVPAGVPLDPALAGRVQMALEKQVIIRPDDFMPSFELYRWRDMAPRADEVLAQFGDQLELLALWQSAGEALPGQVLEIVSYWRVLRAPPVGREAQLFVQVLGPEGGVVAQQDRLEAPSWCWQPGDRFYQLFRLSLPAELSPGVYQVILGAYTVPDRVEAVLAGQEPDPSMPRLPVRVESELVGDFLALSALELRAGD